MYEDNVLDYEDIKDLKLSKGKDNFEILVVFYHLYNIFLSNWDFFIFKQFYKSIYN